MPHNLIVMGASAGGLEALTRIVRGLSSSISASILIVLHISERSMLPAILAREGALPASHAVDGEALKRGRIYVAPPGQHLLVEGNRVRLRSGPRENGHRPAIDPLFRSAARSARQRVVGVILSGQLDDGVAGLFAIKARGGVAVVQDPSDAGAPSMPLNALRYVDADHCATAADIGPLLVALTKGARVPRTKSRTNGRTQGKKEGRTGHQHNGKPSSGNGDSFSLKAPPSPAGGAAALLRGRRANKIGDRHRATPSENPERDPLRCPDCAGPLYRVQNGTVQQWRCREGHVFSPDSLNGAQTEALERALWLAVRTMKERALIDRTIAADFPSRGDVSKERHLERATATERDVDLLREILERI